VELCLGEPAGESEKKRSATVFVRDKWDSNCEKELSKSEPVPRQESASSLLYRLYHRLFSL